MENVGAEEVVMPRAMHTSGLKSPEASHSLYICCSCSDGLYDFDSSITNKFSNKNLTVIHHTKPPQFIKGLTGKNACRTVINSLPMALTQEQQFFSYINKSQRILITFPKHYTVDALGSALALADVLVAMDKRVDVICDGFASSPTTSFLVREVPVYTRIYGIRQLVISLPVAERKVTDFSYDVKDGKLSMYITPETGSFDEKSIKVSQSQYKYDLVITLDTDSLDALGSVHADHTDFFYATPIINIAHRPENEQFGEINIVEIAKSSVAEVVYELLEVQARAHITEHVATCLLAGIMSKTKGFKTNTVTPRALNMASQLIMLGAKRDVVVKNLFQTKSIGALKLWGKVLARLKYDSEHRIAWSFVQNTDFRELSATPDELRSVIEELIVNAPEAEVILICYEYPAGTHQAILYTNTRHDSLKLLATCKPFGDKTFAHCAIPHADLIEGANKLLDTIRAELRLTR